MILVIDLRFLGYGRFPPLAKWAGLRSRAHNAGADLMPVALVGLGLHPSGLAFWARLNPVGRIWRPTAVRNLTLLAENDDATALNRREVRA